MDIKTNKNFIDKIIHLLFIKEKENLVKKELGNYIYGNITKISNKDSDKFIINILNLFKNELFDESKEYHKKIENDITPILIIQNIIKLYTKNPNVFFILLNPIFDMYKSLEPKQIIQNTEKIIELLEDKNDIIILKKFNELFEVVVLLLINQVDSVKNVGNSLNNLLKTTLKKNTIKLDDKNIFDFELFEDKILSKTKLNMPLIDGFLIDWINELCNIETLNIYIGKDFYNILPVVINIEKKKKNKRYFK